MTHHRNILPILFLLFSIRPAEAQITEVAEHPGGLTALRSLGSGVRLIEPWPSGIGVGGTRIIRNLDMSVHRVLNYPAAPPGMVWISMWYITEALFDNDPGTIEFIMVAGQNDVPPSNAVFVFREDGTQLFVLDPGNFNVQLGGTYQGSDPVFMEQGAAYMVLDAGGWMNGPTKLFALPGTLPCFDCHGTPGASDINVGLTDAPAPPSGMTVHPNPGSTLVQVLLPGHPADALLVFDAGGRMVLRHAMNGATAAVLDIGHLRPGLYHVRSELHGLRSASVPLVVVR